VHQQLFAWCTKDGEIDPRDLVAKIILPIRLFVESTVLNGFVLPKICSAFLI